ncbi:MAG: tetratricopeptide repeat protein [Verrucomicrobia bacterium]|nr:tetratricopeptide repeat protein [Verrucomicrobiota bacterium]
MQELLRIALRHHLEGRLAEAERLYQDVLTLNPRQPDALRLLGVLYRQRGQLEAARSYLERAVSEQPATAEAYHDLGLVWSEASQFDKAISAFDQALHLKPMFLDAHYNLGNAYYASGNRSKAAECFSRAVELQPDLVEGHLNLGLIAFESGELVRAIHCYRTALRYRPDYAEALFNLGLAAREAGDLTLAADSLVRALNLKPDNPSALLHLGFIRQAQSRDEEAEGLFRRLLAVEPNHHLARLNLALLCDEMGRLEEATRECQAVLALAPDDPESNTLMGALLKKQKRLDASVQHFERALQVRPGFVPALLNLAEISLLRGGLEAGAEICQKLLAINPDNIDAHVYLGLIRSGQGRPVEAVALFQRALQLDATQHVARLHLGLTQLLLGDYPSGFVNYEARWLADRNGPGRRQFDQPEWEGEELRGRTILLHAEQGLGDSIQFVRYARLVAQRGGRVLVECDPSLKALFRSAEGISAVISRGEPLPGFDVHSPFLSLPRVLGTTLESVPNQVPYLRAPTDAVFELPRVPGLKVGLVWAGNPNHANDNARSMPLPCLSPIWTSPGVAVFSLQLGAAQSQLNSVREAAQIIDLSPRLKDFGATAQAVSQLDLIIGVDTAVVHLAGSLGKAVWLLLPHVNDWRWGRESVESPWYPTLRIFRQTKPGDWSVPVERVAQELRACAGRHGKSLPSASSGGQPTSGAGGAAHSQAITCSIIIPVFNQVAYTTACLEALFRNTPANLGLEIIVVDNGSADGTGDFLRRASAAERRLIPVSLPKNMGFSHACNYGAKVARGRYLLFLNNDTVPQPNWLDHLLMTASRPEVAAVGPKLLYPGSRKINHAGYVYNEKIQRFYSIYHRFDEDFHGVTKERDFQALLGACLLVKQGAFFAVGMFGEYGGEDIDLCLKLRQQGLRIIYNPLSTVLHHGSVTLSNSPPGTIPPSDVGEFCSRWPAGSLVADDERFYREDGFGLRGISADGQIDLKEDITESCEWAKSATALSAASEGERVEQLFQKALSLYQHNVSALGCLMELYCRADRVEDALRCATCLRRIKPGDSTTYLRLAELLEGSGDRARAAEVLEYLSLFPDLPNAISLDVERRTRRLRSLPNETQDRPEIFQEPIL